MEAYTKGPWLLDKPAAPELVSDNYHFIKAAKGYCEGNKGFAISGFMTISDGRLIAAAPELLEALKYMYDSARELSCDCFELGAIEAAREAIAKAEGK